MTLTPVHDVYRPHVKLAVIGVNCENYIVKMSDVTIFLSSHQNKDQLWKQVETTLSNHSVEQIVDSLVLQSQQGAVVEGARHENQHPQRHGEAQVYNGVVK